MVPGGADDVRTGLEDQVGVAVRVETEPAATWSTLVDTGEEDFLLLAEPGLRLAPDALACAARRLQDAPSAGLAWFCDRPDAPVGTPDVAAELLQALAAGTAGGRGNFLVCRGSLASLPREVVEDAAESTARALLWLLARESVVAVAGGKVRAPAPATSLSFPAGGLEPVEEDLFFLLGGGRTASLRARAQVREGLATTVLGGGGHSEPAARWRREAALLRGVGPSAETSAARARLLAEGVAWPALPAEVSVRSVPSWVAPPVMEGALDLAGARSARAAARRDFEREAMKAAVLRCEIEELHAQSTRSPGAVGEPCFPQRMARAPDGPGAEGETGVGGDAALRLVLAVPTLDEGGLESVVRDQALALPGLGVRVLVVVEQGGGRIAREMRSAGVDLVALGRRAPAEELGRVLDRFRPDLVVSHYSLLAPGPAAVRGIPAVAVLHNEYGWLGARAQDPMAAMDRAVQGYIAVSESVRAFHARRFGVSAERIAVVRNAPARSGGAEESPGARSRVRGAFGVPEGDTGLLLVSVGRIEPVKNQLLLVEAVAVLRERGVDARLVLAGGVADPLYALRLERRIEALGLDEVVHLPGLVEDIPGLLAASDLFVLPSLFEGLSLAAAEALSAGLPAVLSPTGDAAWLLDSEGDVPAGIVAALPAQDPFASDPGVAIGQAATPSASDIACLAKALADACARLPELRAGAEARAESLRTFFAPERPVRETFALLQQAAGSVDLDALSRITCEQRANNERLAAERESAWGAARSARDAEIDYFRLRNRIRRRLVAAWRQLRPA